VPGVGEPGDESEQYHDEVAKNLPPEGQFDVPSDQLPDDLSDPRWAHYRSDVNGEFDVPPPEGSRPIDEIELEAEFGSDIWQTEQGPLAEDITELREITRDGREHGLLGHLIGADAAHELFLEAYERGDDESADAYLLEEDLADPQRFLDGLRRVRQIIEDYGLANPDELDHLGADPGEDPDPPVTVPPRSDQTSGAPDSAWPDV
jgi:hypothetical protein